jgi:hypothetical protein
MPWSGEVTIAARREGGTRVVARAHLMGEPDARLSTAA